MDTVGPLAHRVTASSAHGSLRTVDWASTTGFGSLLMSGAVVLYVSGLSRAVGVVIFPVGAVAAVAGLVMRRRGRWPGRLWVILYAVLVALLVVYGVWLLIYSSMHPPVPVVPAG